MKNNSDIFLCYENISALYKINDNKNKSSSDNGKNEIGLLIKEGGDRYYIDGKYIYFFDEDILNKYILEGNKVYSSKVYYDVNLKITPNTHSILTLECSVKENDERVIYKQQRG